MAGEMTAGEAAERLGITRQRALELLRRGDLDGYQLTNGNWVTTASAVGAWDREERATPGRPWSSASSWAVIAELAGRRDGFAPLELHRARTRIRRDDAATLTRKSRRRANITRWRSNEASDIARFLQLTGRSSAHLVSGLLRDRSDVVDGYLPEAIVSRFVAEHLLLPAGTGDVNVIIRELPNGTEIPDSAMTAAFDLADSPSARERSIALTYVQEARASWLKQHAD